jgi:glycosyltransferase involved in cell wall biosynthesis
MDEGYKNVSFNIARGLSSRNNVTLFNVKTAFSIPYWRKALASAPPSIIHYVTSPTLLSFLLLRLMSALPGKGGPKTIISAIAPDLSAGSMKLVSILRLRPDLVIVQSREDEIMFRKMGCGTGYLPNGVDVDRFKPANSERRAQLREKYGLPADRKIILHVGHLKEDRNIQVLEKIGDPSVLRLVVGSRYMGIEDDLHARLVKNGFRVILGYVERIEELYALSDIYVFPVKKNRTIAMPLSVLEAMACNLPVVSMKFPGLASFLEEGAGLSFAEDEDELVRKLSMWLAASGRELKPETRDQVKDLSWEKISLALNGMYVKMLEGTAN